MRRTTKPILQGFLVFLAFLPGIAAPQLKVKPGADVLVEERLRMLDGKRVGLITNHTGRLSSGEFLVSALLSKNVTVTALFAPEHGIRGSATAGEQVDNGVDPGTGIRVHSLYGKVQKPTREMLHSVDVLVYDIQDVGVRFYTYITTMKLAMEAAAEAGLPFVVLDRPNPLGGLAVDGPLLEDSLRSFVGSVPVPIRYGLTCGELALMINGEGWLAGGLRANLTVVQMKGWHRSMHWEETGLPWISPSPNITTPAAAELYPGTCLIEGTNVSEGRGTPQPFLTIGAPFISADSLSEALLGLGLPGVEFDPVSFTPTSSKYKGQLCHGVSIQVKEPESLRGVFAGLSILAVLRDLYPSHFVINKAGFNRLVGNAAVREHLLAGESATQITEAWRDRLTDFVRKTERYWLYPAR